MSKEYLSNLLIADFENGEYANAFILQGRIVTAHHVSGEQRKIRVPHDNEEGVFDFLRTAKRDVAVSTHSVRIPGFADISHPQIDQKVVLVGHHGRAYEPFSIRATIVEIAKDGRVVIEREVGEKEFQLGMSGSPAVSELGVVGLLTESVKRGTQVRLEPAHLIFSAK